MADFALVDHRAHVLMDELDRVLDRDDVLAHSVVHVIDHRRERGRLARAGGAGEQHDAALLLGGVRATTGGRDSSSIVLMWRGIARQAIEITPALLEGVDPEARRHRGFRRRSRPRARRRIRRACSDLSAARASAPLGVPPALKPSAPSLDGQLAVQAVKRWPCRPSGADRSPLC